ncbi:ATP-dependent DNA helicase [Nitrincola alkalilacustris]|uniref:ATP-dependent DNA helicase n=1 Tax=Nitrincola alkalilacustris TaxID=1571224 RepID=UPI00197E011E|nr:ATP-dependent DNA helicase [Nitrincola alkalilacustris]
MALIKVAVRTLCEFAARSGDLDHRYTPSPTAQEGIEGHGRVTRRRDHHYQSERLISGECEGLELKGRADGFDPVKRCLEEIKTHRGDLSRISAAQQALHWAQLRVYGALLCAEAGFDTIELALIYFDIGRDHETRLTDIASAQELWQQLENLCHAYRHWAEQEAAHRLARDTQLTSLRFPFADFREGQRALSENVYKAILSQRHLMLEAPTGLGKTLGTLYPALMAMPRSKQDRLFFLTARNTGRQLALESIQQLQRSQSEPVTLRVLELTAREQACEHPTFACHGESCPLAKGFFDRLPAARASAAASSVPLDRETLRQIALAHQICPYYLGQEMARWCDLVVADVNHFFDQYALLHALTRQNEWRVTLLIDEAHNLITRARGMYSINLHQQQLLEIKREATVVQKEALKAALKKPLQRMARQWNQLIKDAAEAGSLGEDAAPSTWLATIPEGFSQSLQGLASAITDYLTEAAADARLQQLMFEALAFVKLLETLDDHSICELSREGRGKAVLSIHNLIPADFLQPRFSQTHSCILFSATLSPPLYYRDLLGLPDTTHCQSVGSPFSAGQLQVRIESRISTRYTHRNASVQPIADLIAEQYQQQPGNYLIYCSSFAYLDAIQQAVAQLAPDIPIWCQTRRMAEQDRRDFLAQFREEGRGVGFAVLGGVFGEGIDLPGKRLIGAMIATLGLPPYSPLQEILKQRLQQRFGSHAPAGSHNRNQTGYLYAYLYPGLQKVIQAAGRVIRTPEDCGTIILIDDRFNRPEVKQLLPTWWQVDG